jgi:hypothetical protein
MAHPPRQPGSASAIAGNAMMSATRTASETAVKSFTGHKAAWNRDAGAHAVRGDRVLQQQRVPIGRRLRYGVARDGAARTAAVLHAQRLAERFGELAAEPRDGVRRAARRYSDDETDGTVRVRVGLYASSPGIGYLLNTAPCILPMTSTSRSSSGTMRQASAIP